MDNNTTNNSLTFETNQTHGIFNITQPLPIGWETFCLQVADAFSSHFVEVRNDTLVFQCDINTQHAEYWDIVVLRQWIQNSVDKYFFNINCESGVDINLPWPFKSANLVGLHVHGCHIRGYFSEIQNEKVFQLSDEMTSLRIEDSIIIIDLMNFVAYMSFIEFANKDFSCGQEESLSELVLHNMTYEFAFGDLEGPPSEIQTNETDQMMDKVVKVGSEFIHNSRKIEFTCNYQHLKLIDQSVSNGKSRFHSPLMTERSLFPELRVLNMSGTGINEIPPEYTNWRRFFPKLQLLDLSNNAIDDVGFEMPFEDKHHILQVNLTNNNITEINAKTVHSLADISNIFVDISDNPFHCECSPDMKKFLKLIREDIAWSVPSYVRYSYIRNLPCATPSSAKGKRFIDINEVDMNCEIAKLPLALIVGFVVIIVILIIIIIILARLRREIQILIYTRLNIILPCQSTEPYQRKVFDAFVSYSNADEIWVQKTFVALEQTELGKNNRNFQFCLHQRDFIAGKTIFDNIIESVESSRHTVIVISRSFLQSQWCMYEFQEAFKQSIIERKRHLILVMLEDIKESELPKDLKRCIKTFTYIRKDDSIFLDRLIFALSYKRRKYHIEDTPKVIIHDDVFHINNRDMDTFEIQMDEPASDKSKLHTIKGTNIGSIDQIDCKHFEGVVNPVFDENMKSYDKHICSKNLADEMVDENYLNSLKKGQQNYNCQVSYEPNIGNSNDETSTDYETLEANSIYNRHLSDESNTCPNSDIPDERNNAAKRASTISIGSIKKTNQDDNMYRTSLSTTDSRKASSTSDSSNNGNSQVDDVSDHDKEVFF